MLILCLLFAFPLSARYDVDDDGYSFFRNEKKNKIFPGPWPDPQARNKAASHDDGNDAADNEKSPSRERSKYFAWLKGRAQNQKDNPSALFNNNITKYFHFHSFHFLHQSPPAVAPSTEL